MDHGATSATGCHHSWRPWRLTGLFVATGAMGCGTDFLEPRTGRTALEVSACPRGGTFEGEMTVELVASRPAEIRYNLEGQDPLGPGSALYEGPIRVDRTTLMTFLAIGADGVWSEPRSELYSATTPLERPTRVGRALDIDRTNYFFLAKPGETERMSAVFELESRGFVPVHVRAAEIRVNPRGSGFYELEAFVLGVRELPFDLAPGESTKLVVTYAPTVTLRSAALVVESDDELHQGGSIEVELWGRIMSW